MPNIKISQLPIATVLTGAEVYAVVQSGVTKQASVLLSPNGGTAVIAFLTVAQVQATVVDASVSVLQTQGYYIAGDGGGALYARASPQPDHSMWIQSGDNAFWVPLPDASGAISVLAAGAVADGDFDDSGVGTDSYPMIQALIDAHTYFSICSYVSFPRGSFRITNCVQCGYGGGDTAPAEFVSTHLRGSGGGDNTGDTVLVCDFSDRPGMNLQGQRYFSSSGISLRGGLADFISDNDLGGDPVVDDSISTTWDSPFLSPNASSQTAPFAGIAVDGLSGDPPSTSYPALPVPAFIGTIGPYNRAFSSRIIVDNCILKGFDTGYVVHPGDGGGVDGNGDFHDLTNITFAKCKYGISVGHTQCRQVNRYNCEYVTMFCGETTSTHGNLNGKMEGVSVGCSIGQVINLHIFDNDLSIAGPIKYDKLYGEDVWRLGVVTSSSGAATSIEYNNCNIQFGLQDPDAVRGIPAWSLESFSNPMSILFVGGAMFSYYSVFAMWTGTSGIYRVANNLSVDGTWFVADNFGIKDTLWERAAQNVLAGGISVQPKPQVVNGRMRIRTFLYDLSLALPGDAGNTGEATIFGPLQGTNSSFPCSAYAEYAVGTNVTEEAKALVPRLYSDIDMTGTSAQALVSRVLTFTYAPTTYDSMRWGPRIGDVLIDGENSGSVFYVRNKVGNVITVELQNNFKPATALALSSLTWAAGTATATTSVPHGIPASAEFYVSVNNVTPNDYEVTNVLATRTGVSTFTYALTDDPGGAASVPGVYWTFTPINAVDPTTGTWRVINSRVYAPNTYLIGDITSGSGNVVNAGSPDGLSGADGDVIDGHWYLVTNDTDELSFPVTDDVVSAMAPTSFTIGSNARYTEVRHKFKFFIKPSAIV